tara:strand:- start:385 stop:732 length:348 start_codon:yes stop_codon:yes gene_type:complete
MTTKKQRLRKMRFTNIVSATALAVALGFSGSAFAETSVGGVTVSDEDLPRVTAYCQQLQDDTLTEPAGDDDEAASAGANSSESEPSPNGTDQALTTVDMSTIDLQGCMDAGLVTE